MTKPASYGPGSVKQDSTTQAVAIRTNILTEDGSKDWGVMTTDHGGHYSGYAEVQDWTDLSDQPHTRAVEHRSDKWVVPIQPRTRITRPAAGAEPSTSAESSRLAACGSCRATHTHHQEDTSAWIRGHQASTGLLRHQPLLTHRTGQGQPVPRAQVNPR
jgi:hypothetical protein